ncbi:MAG TPA: SgcJ/EcaC family oxidoreductase [Flavobacterium sp.]|nr:SgcJ/EcaC family oxidoreductase [Flavobacterium sp.]
METEIKQLFQDLKEAWNKGDAALYASYFTYDCDYVAFNGQHLTGRQENAETHHKLFKGFLKGSKLTGEIKAIRFLTPEIAICHSVGAVQLRFQKSAPKNRLSINTNVVIKTNGSWKIAAFQNTRIKRPNIIQRLFSK